MVAELEARIVEPMKGQQHTHTIIFLHGRGHTGDSFANAALATEKPDTTDESQKATESLESRKPNTPRRLREALPTVKWIFPSAPCTSSVVGRFRKGAPKQWFDMSSIADPHERRELQAAGLQQNVAAVLRLVRNEEFTMPRRNIFLAGVGKGFATLFASCVADGFGGLGGLIGFNSWIPYGELDELGELVADDDCDEVLRDATVRTPVLLGHFIDNPGKEELRPVAQAVPIAHGKALRKALRKAFGKPSQVVEWHKYESEGHWGLDEPQGADDMIAFVYRQMQSRRHFLGRGSLDALNVASTGCQYSRRDLKRLVAKFMEYPGPGCHHFRRHIMSVLEVPWVADGFEPIAFKKERDSSEGEQDSSEREQDTSEGPRDSTEGQRDPPVHEQVGVVSRSDCDRGGGNGSEPYMAPAKRAQGE